MAARFRAFECERGAGKKPCRQGQTKHLNIFCCPDSLIIKLLVKKAAAMNKSAKDSRLKTNN